VIRDLKLSLQMAMTPGEYNSIIKYQIMHYLIRLKNPELARIHRIILTTMTNTFTELH